MIDLAERPGTAPRHQGMRGRWMPCRAPGASLESLDGGPAISLDGTRHRVGPFEALAWDLCDGTRTADAIEHELADAPGRTGPGDARAAVGRLRELGLFETIEEAILGGLLAFHGPDLSGLAIEDLFTGDYFTAVLLNDGSQGTAINFNNVSGPHRASYNHHHYDDLLMRLARTDNLLLDSFLRRRGLDCLGESVKVALLNAMSTRFVTPGRLREDGLCLSDGYLDLAARLRDGDTVAMIGCTGNYSCPEVGKVASLRKVYFSDFEYTGPFRAGIEACIRRFFAHPEKVELSDGSRNREICAAADVVVIIADTICTGTLDQLLTWSVGAREVLITGRSYVMDYLPVFHRGATAMTSQRIVRDDFIGFLRAKVRRGEFGFTDPVVECFQRTFVTEA